MNLPKFLTPWWDWSGEVFELLVLYISSRKTTKELALWWNPSHFGTVFKFVFISHSVNHIVAVICNAANKSVYTPYRFGKTLKLCLHFMNLRQKICASENIDSCCSINILKATIYVYDYRKLMEQFQLW